VVVVGLAPRILSVGKKIQVTTAEDSYKHLRRLLGAASSRVGPTIVATNLQTLLRSQKNFKSFFSCSGGAISRIVHLLLRHQRVAIVAIMFRQAWCRNLQRGFTRRRRTTSSGCEILLVRQRQHEPSSTFELAQKFHQRRSFASSLPQREFLDEPDSSSATTVIATTDEVAVQVTARTTTLTTPTTRPRLTELRAKLKTEQSADGSGGGAKRHAPLLPRTTNRTTDESSGNNIKALRTKLANLPDPETPAAVLTDQFQRQHTYLRLSVTERCNLRCTYCMPEQGVPLQKSSKLLTTEELLTLAQHFSHQGVTKFRLTGGEPTLRSDLLAIVDGLNQLQPQSIGMTTNGIALGGGNGKLQALVQAGLTGLNLSLDTLDAAEFAALTRRPESYLQRVLQCLEEAVDIANSNNDSDTNFVVKLNCVVMRGTNDHCVADFVRMSANYPGLQVRFIEYMPFSDNGWNWDKCVPYRELLQRLRDDDNIELKPLPADDPHDTTKWFTYDAPGANNNSSNNSNSNKIGFITSMSHHFCGTCNRLRLTADGQIKVCLFDGSTEVSLRDALRAGCSPAELNKLIHAAVQTKHAALGGHKDPADIMRDAANNRPMTLIGG